MYNCGHEPFRHDHHRLIRPETPPHLQLRLPLRFGFRSVRESLAHEPRSNPLEIDFVFFIFVPLFRWQLESARYDPGNRDVLVQFLPAQGIPVDFNLDPRQLLLGSRGQDTEPVGRETHDSSVVQLNVYRPPFGPRPQRDRLRGNPWFIDYGTHRMPLSERHDVRKPTAQCDVTHEVALLGFWPGGWPAPTKTCTHPRASSHGCAPAPVAHPSRNET